MSEGLAIVLLAAGSASRFGGGKLDRMLAGKKLGQWALDHAAQLGPVQLVVGDSVPVFAEGEALIANPDAATGLASSVACAARQAEASGAEKLLLVLADMPLVSPETLRALVQGCTPGQPAATLYPGGSRGIPACFPRAHFAALMALEGDRGAGPLLRNAKILHNVTPPADELRDVDTAEDLAALEALIRT